MKTMWSDLFGSSQRLPILFVHTPKTAGTSFRKAAVKSRKIYTVLCDYGKDNKTTSPDINEARYYSDDNQAVGRVLDKHKGYVLMGHFSSDCYKMHFYPYEIGIFIREPVDRVLSNFYHKQRNGQFDGNLEEFINTTAAINLQFNLLGKLAPEYYGFIGISDQYDESIDLINSLYSLGLTVLTANSNPNKNTQNYEISPENEMRIRALNKLEIQLYKTARKLFASKVKYKNIKFPLYGSWHMQSLLKISGRAYRAYSKDAVVLRLEIDGEYVSTAAATNHDPIPCDVKQPRDGYIGFEFDLLKPITNTHSIKIVATDTNEPIFDVENW